MAMVVLVCLVLLVVTTVIHYEVLRGLAVLLPGLGIKPRAKLIVVIIAAFLAHALEIALYALAIWGLVRFGGLGTLDDSSRFSLDVSLYFSAETYTSLGYGDVVPGGAVRLLAGVEALNGLLLIGWSASYTYIAMERFWSDAAGRAA
ncbi:MAG: two pore domain potassium channel family protein [Zoogloea sp.]|nr:two pore domain potassium channel family protein [Zoogloea sp.]MBP7392899.1 two pore domain potassium channel family protein [Zoogloea sp.]